MAMNSRHSKIVCTLGPATEAEQTQQREPDDEQPGPVAAAPPLDPADGEHADRGDSGKPVLLRRHRVYNG